MEANCLVDSKWVAVSGALAVPRNQLFRPHFRHWVEQIHMTRQSGLQKEVLALYRRQVRLASSFGPVTHERSPVHCVWYGRNLPTPRQSSPSSSVTRSTHRHPSCHLVIFQRSNTYSDVARGRSSCTRMHLSKTATYHKP